MEPVRRLDGNLKVATHTTATRTPAARRARIARESMARTRARRAGTNPLLEQSKAAHDAYLAACRARKDALAELDRNVREAWAAYEAARDAAKV
jgi:hypothetical protein